MEPTQLFLPHLVLLMLSTGLPTTVLCAARGPFLEFSSSPAARVASSNHWRAGDHSSHNRRSLKTASQPLPASPLNVTSSAEILWFFGTPYTQSYIGEGETVVWRWFDTKAHSVEGVKSAANLFTGPGGGANVITQKNFTYKYTFAKAGTYEYQDHQYPYIMKGKVVVKPKYNFGGTTIQWYLGASFGACSAIVQVGDTVTWEWADDVQHGVTALDGNTKMFSGQGANNNTVTEQGFKLKKTFTVPGVYLYKCTNHGTQMQGNITVLPKAGGDAGGPGAPVPPTATVPPAAKPVKARKGGKKGAASPVATKAQGKKKKAPAPKKK